MVYRFECYRVSQKNDKQHINTYTSFRNSLKKISEICCTYEYLQSGQERGMLHPLPKRGYFWFEVKYHDSWNILLSFNHNKKGDLASYTSKLKSIPFKNYLKNSEATKIYMILPRFICKHTASKMAQSQLFKEYKIIIWNFGGIEEDFLLMYSPYVRYRQIFSGGSRTKMKTLSFIHNFHYDAHSTGQIFRL